MKPIFFLFMMACVVSLPAADEPKASPQQSVDEVRKELEALQQKIKTLEEEKKAILQEMSDGRLKFVTPPPPKDGDPFAKHGYIIVDPKNTAVINKALEVNGTEYMSLRMSMEMAERHSAEKIEARVREADAKARRILEGHPPSPVHGN